MFSKLINFIKNYFLLRKLKKQYRAGTLVFQPETLMYYIVETYTADRMLVIDEHTMAVGVPLEQVQDKFIPVQSVKCGQGIDEYRVENVDAVHYTVLVDGRYLTLEDLNEGNF